MRVASSTPIRWAAPTSKTPDKREKNFALLGQKFANDFNGARAPSRACSGPAKTVTNVRRFDRSAGILPAFPEAKLRAGRRAQHVKVGKKRAGCPRSVARTARSPASRRISRRRFCNSVVFMLSSILRATMRHRFNSDDARGINAEKIAQSKIVGTLFAQAWKFSKRQQHLADMRFNFASDEEIRYAGYAV